MTDHPCVQDVEDNVNKYETIYVKKVRPRTVKKTRREYCC